MFIKDIDKQLGRLISTIENYNFPGCPMPMPICSDDYSPVCGTDGETYSNKCVLFRTSCERGDTDLDVASEGECAGITLYHQHNDLRSSSILIKCLLH